MFEARDESRHVRIAWGVYLACLVGACAINPVTGERELALVSEPQEIEMGREGAAQVRSTMGLVDDESLQHYVEGIGLELAGDSERPDLPWSFAVVNDPTPNAFALPGGHVFVTRGLIGLMNSEAELAAVLGHEIGHVTARHSVNQISRAELAQLGLGLGAVLSPEVERFGDLAGFGLGVLFLKYGRDDERQADELGFRYMRAEGYDVREMASVFGALQASGDLAGRSPVPTWLASHPNPAERIVAVRQRIAALPQPATPGVVDTDRYLMQIDGLVHGEDRRLGYFEGDSFVHPELAFRLTIPEAWMRQNLASAVMAVSPERDMVVELRIARGAPVDAAREFVASNGVVELDTRRVDQGNGSEGIVTHFAGQAQQGRVVGIVGHYALGAVTYRFLTYTPESRFDRNRSLLDRIVTSFAPLSGNDVADVINRRLSIVELDRAMSLQAFDRRYPSEIALEELAVINQVDDASATLAAGTRLKRVL